jgi:hypothetical protein
MMATELLHRMMELIAEHGDIECFLSEEAMTDGDRLRVLRVSDVSVEQDQDETLCPAPRIIIS